ncbi:MAG TPA: hypothetical protein PKD05_06690 [Candidatus Melainabacteria bacterium]|nr:hypothetical protein [Candidatus Melainabacteria bacterium]HMP51227.1 hypothetical protein [Candidatus Melainabacteria bacterium]
MLARSSELSKKFVDIERDFIREKLLPDFEYTGFNTATAHKNPHLREMQLQKLRK